MARTLSVSMQSASSNVVTRPGYLILLSFAGLDIRYSTTGDVTWNGNAWAGNRSVDVKSLSSDSGSVTFGNVDDAFAAMVLGSGVVDRPVRIWAMDGEALGDTDPVLVFDGVGDSSESDVEKVTISLVRQGSGSLSSPRRFIGKSAGFNHLIPAGTVLTVGNQKVTLERW